MNFSVSLTQTFYALIAVRKVEKADFFKACPTLCNVYLFLRERESVSRGGTEREGDTESEAGSRLQAVSTELNVGLKLTNPKIMT